MLSTHPTNQALMEALRASLWGKAPDVTFFEDLNEQDWRTIFQLSIHQTVEGMVGSVIQNLPEQSLPPAELQMKWLVRTDRIQRRNAAMSQAIGSQYKLFQREGLRSVLQKGHGVSAYYLDPSLRVSGDIDWFFPVRADYDAAQRMVLSEGAVLKNSDKFSCGLEWGGFLMEQHRRIVQLRNPFIQDVANRFVSQELANNIKLEYAGVAVEIPTGLLNLVQVNAHILKHQVTYGIGLRQLCDACRLYYTFGKQIDPDQLKKIYSGLGMLKWSHYLHQILVDFFHLPVEYLPYPIERHKGVEWMKDYILRTGNFGFFDPEHPDEKNPGGRVDRPERLFKNFCQFIKIAPMEALSFPLYQIYIKSFR